MKLKLPANAAHLSPIIAIGAWALFIGLIKSRPIASGDPWPQKWEYIIAWTYSSIVVLLLASGGIGLFLSFQASRQRPWTLVSGILGGLANALFLLFIAFLIYAGVWGAV